MATHPLEEDDLGLAVGDEEVDVVGIEEDVVLNAVLGVELRGAHRRLAVNSPVPD